jgi:hypothetical protein
MKLSMAFVVAIAGGAEAGEIAVALPMETVKVCIGTPVPGIPPALLVTSGIFARIGVRIDWLRASRCPSDALLVSFQTETDASLLPGALAWAQPYEKVNIGVFYDRMRAFGRDTETDLLGHVLAHEIAHMLQGTVRHSNDGVMKNEWTPEDRRHMAHNQPLSFTPLDVALIRAHFNL